jgi:hypothetical protein
MIDKCYSGKKLNFKNYLYNMPYCKKQNILWIHIPKTGGASIYIYFTRKYGKSNVCLFSGPRNKIFHEEELQKISLQHQTYETLITHKELLNIELNDKTKIFTVVRNPYERIISDLFGFNLIDINSSQEQVFEIIKNKYLYRDDLDNHNIPQYLFLCDKNGNLHKEITILKTETLINDMKNHGFTDFSIHFGSTISKGINVPKKKYISYLNNNSILIINEFYKIDFELFNYNNLDI